MLVKKVSVFIFMVLVVAAFIPAIIGAQDANVAGVGGNGLQIAPTRTELGLIPGESKQFSIDVKNITKGELQAEVSINDFESDGLTGNPQILVDTSKRSPTSISNFISGLGNVNLKPGEAKKVNVEVKIPEDAAPGAYFGIVRYAAIPKGGVLNDQERQLSLTASLGHLVLIEVAGDINQQIQVESLKMQKDDKSSSIFFDKPNKSALAIKNLGNGFSRPFGNVVINDFKGSEIYRYEINDSAPKGVVLPNSSRTFVNDISGIKFPGRYTANANVIFDNGGEVVTYKTSFWYLPIWFILLILALLIASIVGARYVYKKQYGSPSHKKRKSSRR